MTTQEPGDSDNPFAPSRVLLQAGLLEQADTWYRLQGRAVICRSTLRLPADCLATGVSGDLSATPLQLQTAGALRAGRILVRPLLLVLSRIFRKAPSVRVTAWISTKVTRRKTFLRLFVVSQVLIMPSLVVLGLLPWFVLLIWMPAGIVAEWFLTSWIMRGLQLKIFRHEAGLFELRGFSDEYLACLERLEFGSLR
ncbi:MAG: hypothetical protein ACK48Y_12800 [Planctomyces sp.]|jgi:hypothetical protein